MCELNPENERENWSCIKQHNYMLWVAETSIHRLATWLIMQWDEAKVDESCLNDLNMSFKVMEKTAMARETVVQDNWQI